MGARRRVGEGLATTTADKVAKCPADACVEIVPGRAGTEGLH